MILSLTYRDKYTHTYTHTNYRQGYLLTSLIQWQVTVNKLFSAKKREFIDLEYWELQEYRWSQAWLDPGTEICYQDVLFSYLSTCLLCINFIFQHGKVTVLNVQKVDPESVSLGSSPGSFVYQLDTPIRKGRSE